MFPYRVQYNESEYYIQNNGLLYKIHQTHQNIFEFVETNRTNQKTFTLLFCNIYNFHNPYFVFFVNFVSSVILELGDFYIYIYITRMVSHCLFRTEPQQNSVPRPLRTAILLYRSPLHSFNQITYCNCSVPWTDVGTAGAPHRKRIYIYIIFTYLVWYRVVENAPPPLTQKKVAYIYIYIYIWIYVYIHIYKKIYIYI